MWRRCPVDVKNVTNENAILRRQVKDQRREIDLMKHTLDTARQTIVQIGKENRQLEAKQRECSSADLCWKCVRIIFTLLTERYPHHRQGERQQWRDKVSKELEVTHVN